MSSNIKKESKTDDPNYGCAGITTSFGSLVMNTTESAATAATTQTSNSEAKALDEAGMDFFEEEKYNKALKKFKKALSIDPTHAAYYHEIIAVCYKKLGDILRFKESAIKCLQADPSYVGGYYILATALRDLWEFEEASAIVEQGLSLDDFQLDPFHERLQELRDSINEHLQYQKRMQKDVLKAEPTTVAFFGGLRPNHQDGGNRIPTESVIARLERNTLPRYAKKLAKQLDSGDHHFSKEIIPVVRAVSSGDFRVEWLLDTSNRKFKLHAYMDDEKQPRVNSGIIISIDISWIFVDEKEYYINDTISTFQNPTYHNHMTDDLRKSIQMIVLQRFYQTKGASLLVGDGNDVSILKSILLQQATEHMTKCRQYKDVASLQMVLMDVCINAGLVEEAGRAMVPLGEALEAIPLYTHAGKLYEEFADETFFPVDQETCSIVLARTYAGLAYKYAEDYIKAEEQYVTALRSVDSVSWANLTTNRDSDVTSTVVQNMIVCYETVYTRVVTGQDVDQELQVLGVTYIVFAGLLAAVGCFGEWEKQFKVYLRKEYKNPSRARRKLQAAFRAPTIGEYRNLLHEALKNANMSISNAGVKNYRRCIEEETAKTKKGARNQLEAANESFVKVDSATCAGCNEMKCHSQMKSCPCQMVSYCSRECQIAHWKTHKKFCPHRKKKI